MHIVLVHGACTGAWIWYKVKPLLEAAGHRVTAIDMAASGIHPAKIQEVNTLAEYTQPLLSFLACLLPHEKVVLVGHCLGGMNLALAMETFPDKISVAVFLAAFLPDTEHYPSYVIEEHFEKKANEGYWMDTKFYPYSSLSNDQNKIACQFGPNFLASEYYQLSPVQDLELAKLLVRPSSFLIHDLCKTKYFTSEKYGSVKKVYIVCEGSEVLPEDFQTWMMMENFHVDKSFTILDSDHMAMCSKPEELTDHLSKIASSHV